MLLVDTDCADAARYDVPMLARNGVLAAASDAPSVAVCGDGLMFVATDAPGAGGLWVLDPARNNGSGTHRLQPDCLLRLFRRETGASIKVYIQREKVRCVRILLTSTVMTVDEIATAFSFRFGSRLARVFSRVSGETPAAYCAKYTHML